VNHHIVSDETTGASLILDLSDCLVSETGAEIVDSKRLITVINELDCFINCSVSHHGQDRSENLFCHDRRIFKRVQDNSRLHFKVIRSVLVTVAEGTTMVFEQVTDALVVEIIDSRAECRSIIAFIKVFTKVVL